jgi:hypothetical protein
MSYKSLKAEIDRRDAERAEYLAANVSPPIRAPRAMTKAELATALTEADQRTLRNPRRVHKP